MIRQRYLVAAMALTALGIAVAPQATAAPGQTWFMAPKVGRALIAIQATRRTTLSAESVQFYY